MSSILYLPTRYFPSISGAEFYFQRMAEILIKKYKYNIEIYTSNAIDFTALHSSNGRIIDKKNKYFSRVNNLKINRFSIDYKSKMEEKIDFLSSFKEFKQLNLSNKSIKKFLENGPFTPQLINSLIDNQYPYDLIHTTYYPYFNLITALMIGKKMKLPTVCTPFFHFKNPRYLKTDYMEILPKFDKLIACTHKEKTFLERMLQISGNNIRVIPMGVDYKKFKDFDKNINFKQKFFKKSEKTYKMILFCGYKNYEKGALSILKAIPYVLDEFKKVYFVFIGPPTRAYNRELSKVRKVKNARIINLTPDNLTGYFDKYKLSAFNETDIYIMPSRSDAFGIAYLEAWSSGKPVIGANIGAISEIIQNGKDGLLVQFDDPIDIKEKIIKLLNSKKLRKKMGKSGQKKVKNNFTWNLVSDKTHQFYRELIKS